MRYVICHYHLFKNSGTSFDELLQKNYGDQFCAFDGPFPFFKISQDELSRVIRNVDAVAYSSHQISLPVPASLEFQALPAVFIRHPLLRIRSIYQFGKKSPEATSGGRDAGDMAFEQWVLAGHDNLSKLSAISNQQTQLLGGTYGREGLRSLARDQSCVADIDQARRNLQGVELLARTEFYEQDVRAFGTILAAYGIDFTYHEMGPSNATSSDLAADLGQRINNVESELGKRTFNWLMDMNRQDLELFDYACQRLDRGG